MKNLLIGRYILMIFLTMLVVSCSPQKKIQNKQPKLSQKEYIEKHYTNLDSIERIEAAIKFLLINKKNAMVARDNMQSNYYAKATEILIRKIDINSPANIKKRIQLACSLFQYCETYNSQYLTEMLGEIFYQKPVVFIMSFTDLEKYLDKDFQNDVFYRSILLGISYASDRRIKKAGFTKKKAAIEDIKVKLKSARNEKNKNYIDFLLEKGFVEK